MSMTVKPYPNYKDAGVSWLGKIPAHWQVQPGFSVFRPKQQKNTGMVETVVLSLSYGRIIVKPEEKLHGLVPTSFETYQIIEPGDIVIRPTDLQNDKTSLRVGLVRDRGIITSAYLCLRVAGPIIPEYGYLLLHTYDLKKIFYGMGSGLRQNLDFTDLKRMPVIVPPHEEQERIVAFLDNLDRHVNRFIRDKRRLIALLNEQKQAIIRRVVTRGLDPTILLKPSGVEWLGEVPAHWKIVKLGHRFRCTSGLTPSRGSSSYFGGEIPWVRTGELTNSDIKKTQEHITREAVEIYSMNLLPKDTLLIAMYGQGQTRGRTGLLKIEATTNQACLAILPNYQVAYPKYVQYWFISQYSHLRYISESRNATQPNLNGQMIKNQRLLLPPVDEQVRLVEDIEEKTQQVDTAITRCQREIELIREYRVRLITDVVTGKLDVRSMKLPTVDEMGAPDEPLMDDAVEEGGELELVEEGTYADN